MLLRFFIFTLISTSDASYLRSYSPHQINAFINSTTQLHLTPLCQSSLRKIDAFLFARETIQEQRDFFYQSYATAESEKFLLSRDRYYWHYRSVQCLKVSAETEGAASEYPFIYCNAYNNLQSDSSVTGLCLPATCFQDKLQLSRHWARSVGVRRENATSFQTVSCSRSRHAKQWFHRPIIVSSFIINKILFALVACASIYHVVRGAKSKSLLTDVFLAFSAIRTFQTITEKSNGQKKIITCIYGLRVTATMWVILGHSSILIQGYLRNLDEYRETLRDGFLHQIITNCFLSVDLFFLLSGTLTAYNWFQRKERKEQIGTFSFWYKFYWHRIVRLWPNLAYLLFYLPTQMAVLHYRPMWKVEDLYDACVHSWWKTLFFINSVTDNDCLPWTWYVGTDFIFYLISPIYLLSLDKSRKLGLVVSVATIATSSVLNAIAMEQFKYPPTQFIWITPSIFNPDFMEHHRTVYIKPQYRIGSHIVGILLGYYLANNKVILSRRKLYCSWLLSIILGFTSLFGLYPALQGWHWWSYHLLYGALHRTAWVIAISWIIFACHNEYASCINRFLSLSLFVYLSKASYSVFLIHLLVVGGLFIKREFPIVFNGIPATLIFVMQDIIVSHLVGFLSVFLIECPFVKIDEAIRKRQKSHKKEVEITKISEK